MHTTTEYTQDCIIDDHWLCASGHSFAKLTLLDLHANTKLVMNLTDERLNTAFSMCLVESRPRIPPVVAAFSAHGQLVYGSLGQHGSRQGLTLPGINYDCKRFLYAQSNNRLVVSGGKWKTQRNFTSESIFKILFTCLTLFPNIELAVIDMNKRSIVSKVEENLDFSSATFHPFNRSTCLAASFNAVHLLDEDMKLVQTMPHWRTKQANMLDEYTLAVSSWDCEVDLFDIRKLSAEEKIDRLIDCFSIYDVHSIDVRNQRMVATAGPYYMQVQIDLKTRKWARIWKPVTEFNEMAPVINDRYLIFKRGNPLQWSIVAYDFDV